MYLKVVFYLMKFVPVAHDLIHDKQKY